MRVQQTLATAVGLMATVAQAAPRLAAEDTREGRVQRARRGLHARWGKWGNAKMAQMEQTKDEMPEGCPTASVIITTTTVDVTVYVTPAMPANTTEPCPEDEMTYTAPPPTSTEPCPEDEMTTTTSEPCPEETMVKWNTTTSEPCPEETAGMWNTTTWMQPTTSEEPCPEETGGWMNTTTAIPMTTGPKTTKVIHISKNMTETTEPCPEETTMTPTTTDCPEETPTTTDCPEETPTSTEPCDEESTWTRHMTHTVKVTPYHSSTATAGHTTTAPSHAAITICVIDTAMTPVTKSSMTSTPVTTVTPTKTICEHDNHTGAPTADSIYCGIKGQPAGVYFIAEFIEERPGVPVTEEGCYQFCDSVMEDTKGCESYRFYTNELGAPRCDLYGMGVSHVVKDIDNNQPSKWYDLACGSPTNQKWHSDKMAAQPNGADNMSNGAKSPNANMKNVANDAAAAAPSEDQKSGKLFNLKLGPLNVGV